MLYFLREAYSHISEKVQRWSVSLKLHTEYCFVLSARCLNHPSDGPYDLVLRYWEYLKSFLCSRACSIDIEQTYYVPLGSQSSHMAAIRCLSRGVYSCLRGKIWRRICRRYHGQLEHIGLGTDPIINIWRPIFACFLFWQICKSKSGLYR